MRLLAEDRQVSVEAVAAGPVLVQGDRARLKQVFVNLLDNAIKHTPAGGRVRVTVSARNGEAVSEVADTGCGIPAEAQPHLFKRFYRVDSARNREQGGAGIGLSIVAAICQAHGGRIEVESVEGRGSTFRARLPLGGAQPISNQDHGS
jgi:signal transduction histidine kinase